MIGPFILDIWSIFFDYFERNYDPYTLNSLSSTCKRLNQMNRDRHNLNIHNFTKKFGSLPDYFYHHRINYNLLNLLNLIGVTDANTITNKTLFSLHPNSHVLLYKLLSKL